MTPAQFSQWLAEMKAAGLIRSQNDAAVLLGISNDMVSRYVQGHSKIRQPIALACRALLHRLEPYP